MGWFTHNSRNLNVGPLTCCRLPIPKKETNCATVKSLRISSVTDFLGFCWLQFVFSVSQNFVRQACQLHATLYSFTLPAQAKHQAKHYLRSFVDPVSFIQLRTFFDVSVHPSWAWEKDNVLGVLTHDWVVAQVMFGPILEALLPADRGRSTCSAELKPTFDDIK